MLPRSLLAFTIIASTRFSSYYTYIYAALRLIRGPTDQILQARAPVSLRASGRPRLRPVVDLPDNDLLEWAEDHLEL